jgi:hypothetical protein
MVAEKCVGINATPFLTTAVAGNQETLFYYGYAHDVKVTFRDCQRGDHLLFDSNHFFT